jgi:predicted ATPase
MRFTHVGLENWRNFRQVEADLAARAFLVGPNASGKSNLLDAFRFLRDVASDGGGLQEAIARRGGVSALRCLSARRHPTISVRVAIGGTGQQPSWQYDLRFNQGVQDKKPWIKRETVSRDGDLVLERPNSEDRSDAERLTQTYLEQVNVNRDFRDVAAFLRSVRYLHIVPQLVREPDRWSAGRQNPFGGDFLEQIIRTHASTQKARLGRIVEALRVAVPHLREMAASRDEHGKAHLRAKYDNWRPRGVWQNEEAFSDGTLRLIGLLWAVLEKAGPLLLEDPELSLHPEVVRYMPQALARAQRESGRQVFVSTHSPNLIADEGIGLDEVLLLAPEDEGTQVAPAAAFEDIRCLLDEGKVTLRDAVVARTTPPLARQLALFPESTGG